MATEQSNREERERRERKEAQREKKLERKERERERCYERQSQRQMMMMLTFGANAINSYGGGNGLAAAPRIRRDKSVEAERNEQKKEAVARRRARRAAIQEECIPNQLPTPVEKWITPFESSDGSDSSDNNSSGGTVVLKTKRTRSLLLPDSSCHK